MSGVFVSSSFSISVGAKTHTGFRPDNQDRITRADTPFGDLYVLADGVGGYRGGGLAAQKVVDGFVLHLRRSGDFPLEDALQGAARSISADLLRKSEESGWGAGMYSTVVLALIDGDQAVIGHVGDSRAYKLHAGQLERLTRDHSVGERLIAGGGIQSQDALSHPEFGVLTRVIGRNETVIMEIKRVAFEPGDALLLCSDGLWGYSTEDEILAVAASPNLSANGVADALVSLALRGGGGDNISVQFVRFVAPVPLAAMPHPARPWYVCPLPRLAMALTLAVTGAIITIQNVKHPIRNTAAPHSERIEDEVILAAPPALIDGSTQAAMPRSDPFASKPKPGPSPRTSVTFLLAGAKDQPKWVQDLARLASVNVVQANPSPSCAALGGKIPAMAASPAGLAEADALRRELQLAETSLMRIPSEKLSACGTSEIFVLPARPSFVDRARSEIKKVREKLQPRKDR